LSLRKGPIFSHQISSLRLYTTWEHVVLGAAKRSSAKRGPQTPLLRTSQVLIHLLFLHLPWAKTPVVTTQAMQRNTNKHRRSSYVVINGLAGALSKNQDASIFILDYIVSAPFSLRPPHFQAQSVVICLQYCSRLTTNGSPIHDFRNSNVSCVKTFASISQLA